MKKTLRSPLVAAMGLLTTGTLIASCSSASSNDGIPEMEIAASHADSLPFMAILQVAIDKDWCQEEGVDASIYSGGGGGNTLRLTTSGEADIAITGSTSVVLAAQQPTSNLDLIGSWFQVNDFYWITPDDSATIEDATLGYSTPGSATELLAKAMQAEMSDENLKVQSVGGMGDNWAAAKAGEIDAGWAMHPFVTDMKVNEGGETLVAARDVVGDQPTDMVAANQDYAEENPEAIKAFFRCAQRGFDYVVDDTDAAAKDLAKIMSYDDPALLAQGLKETPEFEKAYSLKVDPKTLTNLSTMMEEMGQTDETVDWSSLLDQQYLPEEAQTEIN